MNDQHIYDNDYSDSRFWSKVVNFAKSAGKEVIEKALLLYYAAQNPSTPVWAKGVVYGALGYFISPLDIIPDFTPLVGFSDDLGVLAAAIATVSVHITDEVRAQTAKKLKQWFG